MSNTKTKSQTKKLNSDVQFIADESGISEYRLKNGLKILLVENHTAPVVTLLVLYKVGSRNEGVGYTGATHFLEHMLFKGTKNHNPICSPKLALIGMRLHGLIELAITK